MPRSEKTNRAAKPSKSGKSAGTIYQLKITLLGIKPPVWRRLQCKDCTLAQLHETLQVAMGWQFSHLYLFGVAGEHYSDPKYLDDVESDRKVKLSQLVQDGCKKFAYIYDMGDDWEHSILIEKTLAAEPKARYPRCVGGARACPPEDCGGVWGYENLLEALRDPRHPEHDSLLEWAGGVLDPEKFDPDEVNKQLGK